MLPEVSDQNEYRKLGATCVENKKQTHQASGKVRIVFVYRVCPADSTIAFAYLLDLTAFQAFC